MAGCRYRREAASWQSSLDEESAHGQQHWRACRPVSATRAASSSTRWRRLSLSPCRGARVRATTSTPYDKRSAGPKPSATRWACHSGLRPAPKGCLAPGQPECNERATGCESSLLERPIAAIRRRPRALPSPPVATAANAGRYLGHFSASAPSETPQEFRPPRMLGSLRFGGRTCHFAAGSLLLVWCWC